MWQWPRPRTREERDFGTERGSRDRTAADHVTAVVVRSGNNAMQTKLKMKKAKQDVDREAGGGVETTV